MPIHFGTPGTNANATLQCNYGNGEDLYYADSTGILVLGNFNPVDTSISGTFHGILKNREGNQLNLQNGSFNIHFGKIIPL